MKNIVKIIGIWLFAAFALQASAGDIVGKVNAVWSSPAAFKPDQQVTFFFDLSGTSLVGRNDLHLYSWVPETIESWDAPSAKTLLTQTSNPAVYSLTCIPTDLWGKPVADFGLKIEGLVKTNDGSLQTEDFSEANGGTQFKLFDYKTMSGSLAVAFPPDFTAEKPISIIGNLALMWNDGQTAQGELVGAANVYIWLGLNNFAVSSKYNTLGNANARCDFVSGETNIIQYNFLISDVIDNAPKLQNLSFLFNDGTWSKTGRDVKDANGNQDIIIKPFVAGSGSSSFGNFPKKVTQGDIITVKYFPQADTLDSGLPAGLLTGSDRIYVVMEVETSDGKITPVPADQVKGDNRFLMTTGGASGQYNFSFILNKLFTETELDPLKGVTKINFRFENYDGLISPFGIMAPHTLEISKADN